MLWWWEAARSTAVNNVAFMLPSNQSSDRSEGSVNCSALTVGVLMSN